MEIGLHRLVPGAHAVIVQVRGRCNCLLSLGLVPGTVVKCRYRSPEGGVTVLEFQGKVVALRTRQLRRIRADY